MDVKTESFIESEPEPIQDSCWHVRLPDQSNSSLGKKQTRTHLTLEMKHFIIEEKNRNPKKSQNDLVFEVNRTFGILTSRAAIRTTLKMKETILARARKIFLSEYWECKFFIIILVSDHNCRVYLKLSLTILCPITY